VVTGAFSYTGKHIARRLLASGGRVRTLTGHPGRTHEFGDAVEARPFDFENAAGLRESLLGADTLFNTYWVRFSHGETTFEKAIENTRTLIAAAEAAGVRRIVHVSIANPEAAPHLPYYAGKAQLEDDVRRSNMSHAILRPTVIYSEEDVLITNIAWLLRRFPAFFVPGDGRYRLRPIYIGDMADLAVASAMRDDNIVVDAVGPETYTFDELLRLIGRAVGMPRIRVVHTPATVAYWASRALGLVVRDVILTREEVTGLMGDLLVTEGEAAGATRLSEWLREHGDVLGRQYASELARHYR
jgi:NADH dehydrogenase